jgi:choline dehydrogenase
MKAADTLVIGAGAAGCALTGLLVERSDERVVLVEAGPDYGPRDSGRWPAEMLDASLRAPGHDWGYTSGDTIHGRVLPFDRARVVGGCGSHNDCQAMIGHRADYDAWAAAGNSGWTAAELEPLIAHLKERLHVRLYADEEVTPFQSASIDAMVAFGLPRVVDLNDLDQDLGVAQNPVNIVDGVRFNAAFGYLDRVRDRPNLEIVADVLCDRLVVEGGRVTGAVVIRDGRRETISAGRVVLCSGVYGSPAILLRSGVGDPAELHRHAIRPVHALAGVGRNLHDHPCATMRFAGTDELVGRMQAFARERFCPEEQIIGKGRTAGCDEAFDLHFYTSGGARREDGGAYHWQYTVGLMTSVGRGAVTLRSSDPDAPPLLDHGFLRDPSGSDLDRLVDGFAQYEEIAAQPALARLLGAEIYPGPAMREAHDVRTIVARNIEHAYHPVGTCKMGPASDPEAVVDANGRVHGLEGCVVADASIMPAVPRANTHLPSVLVGERISASLGA